EFATGQKWNAPRLEICRRNVVAWAACALFDRWNIAIAARVKRSVASGQRNIAAHGRALQTWNVTQRVECLLSKTLPRRGIRVLWNRQSDRACPKILRAEADVLLSQPD